MAPKKKGGKDGRPAKDSQSPQTVTTKQKGNAGHAGGAGSSPTMEKSKPAVKKQRLTATSLLAQESRLGESQIDITSLEPDVQCDLCEEPPQRQPWADFVVIPATAGSDEKKVPVNGRCLRCHNWHDAHLSKTMSFKSCCSLVKTDAIFRAEVMPALVDRSPIQSFRGDRSTGSHVDEAVFGLEIGGPFCRTKEEFHTFCEVSVEDAGCQLQRLPGYDGTQMQGYPVLPKDGVPPTRWYMKGGAGTV